MTPTFQRTNGEKKHGITNFRYRRAVRWQATGADVRVRVGKILVFGRARRHCNIHIGTGSRKANAQGIGVQTRDGTSTYIRFMLMICTDP